MSLKYLFGPVSAAFAEQNLKQQRSTADCLVFNTDGDAGLSIHSSDTWDDVRSRFPEGWQPDCLVLSLAYTTVPSCLWSAPLPRIGLGPDWNLLWHYYRRCFRSCDLVLTDTAGAEVAGREGILHTHAANLCGCDRTFLESPLSGGDRDIDILFTGNLNPAVQRERMPWLGRLARLGRRWRVLIQSGLSGDSYRHLLARSKIVFQFSSRGKCGRRAFEAAATGALLFQEDGNRELPASFRDRQECIYYRQDNLEQLLEYYLEHPTERQTLTEAARAKVQQCGYEQLWTGVDQRLEGDWSDLLAGGRHGGPADSTSLLQLRCWQAHASGRTDDLTLLRDLERALKESPESALLHNDLGCILLARLALFRHGMPALAEMALRCFRRALACQPDAVLPAVNLAEALEIAGQRPQAIQAAREGLALLNRDSDLDPSCLEGLPLCAGFDLYRVEWERAGWENAGDPRAELRAKRELLLWRLHSLLARWTGEVGHHYEAALLLPDLPGTRIALANTLVHAERFDDAQRHARQALAVNPLDRDASRLCFQTLGASGDRDGQRRLIEEQRLLARALPHVVPSEPWFGVSRPKGNELASLILLCDNASEQTQFCLESLLRWTRPPFELILADTSPAGSTFPALDTHRTRPGPVRVTVVRPENSSGFAASCNEALKHASGRYVVFLTCDTVLTPGWLDGLVRWSQFDWPNVGFVGPVANDVLPPQGIRVPYTSLAELDAFAARRTRECAGQMQQVKRLTGFCLLARREVLDCLGRLDERFDPGFFAEDDLCFRASEAGFRLLAAQDVFVHHFGSRTIKAQDSGARQQLEKSIEVLRGKWGLELTAGYALPLEPEDVPLNGTSPREDTETAPPADVAVVESLIPVENRPPVSLTMIVKNEARNLPECLQSVAGLFPDVVVLDTGSQDNTKEIARRFGARVFELPWQDSFSVARNESLRHARGRYAMWLDADDRLMPDQRPKLEEVLSGLRDGTDAYSMQVRSVLDANRSTFRLLDQIRLFPNRPGVCWDYRIHEQILPSVNRIGGGVRWVNVIVDHVGYQDSSLRHGKLERNLRLLEMDEADRPNDAFSLFNLGWTLLDLGRTSEALPRLQRSLEHAASSSSILRKLYHLLTLAQRQQSKREEALKVCREGLKLFPDDGELLLEEGLMLRENGQWFRAEESWQRLLLARKGNYFASEEVGLRGFRTRQLLAEIYVNQDRLLEAEMQWRAAVAERPTFEPSWLGLAEVYLRKGRWADLEDLLSGLESQGVTSAKIGWLLARGQVQRREFASARRSLDAVIRMGPQAIGPRVLLSQTLLQEGSDPQAAERALRTVLELDPQNKEAQHNLQILLRTQRAMLV